MMNAVVSSNSEVDPFAEVEDECAAVENLAKERSGVLAVSMWETVDGCFYLPVCLELPEHMLFQEVAYERGEETLMLLVKRGVVRSWNQRTSGKCVPEIIASYQGVTSGLQDVLHFPETKGNMKDANELAEVITNVESDRLN